MKVLVTGIAGNLGSGVAQALAEKGHEVIGVDFAPTDIPNVDCRVVNMTDAEACLALGQGMDVIAHLGAYHGVHMDTKSEQEFFDANIASTFYLLRSAAEHQVARVVWASSTVVFERYHQPYGIYSLTKRVGEDMCRYFHDHHHIQIIGLRYGGFVPIDFITRGFGMLETWIEIPEVVKTTVAAIENSSVDFRFYDVQTPLPFAQSDVDEYLAGNKLAVLTRYYPQYADILTTYQDRLPDNIYLSDMELTMLELGFTLEQDFEWFLKQLS